MTRLVKAAGPRDFLSMIPNLLGFQPAESVVLVPFANNRTLGAMRFDLPDVRTDDFRRVASTMTGMVCKVPEATAVAIIAYSAVADHHHVEPLVNHVMARAAECGLDLVDALYVASDGWGSYKEGPEPRPLSELVPPVEDLPAVVGDQLAGAALPTVTEEQREAVALAMVGLAETIGVLVDGEPMDHAPDLAAMTEVSALDDLPTLLDTALEVKPEHFQPYRLATLVWILSRPATRDIGLITWTGDVAAGDAAQEAQLAWEEGAEYPAHLAMVMWGEGDRPDPARLDKALALTKYVAAVAPERSQAGPLATAAWLSWALGRSTQADHLADQALAADPEHGLAEIVKSFVHAGHLPSWAFTR